MLVLLTNSFIGSIKLPRFTCAVLCVYLGLRINHVATYNSVRGHNSAFLAEEFMKFFTVIMIFGAMTSSLMMCGARLPAMMMRK